jgi:hypothetical protein
MTGYASEQENSRTSAAWTSFTAQSHKPAIQFFLPSRRTGGIGAHCANGSKLA